jgi:hypothetical protein
VTLKTNRQGVVTDSAAVIPDAAVPGDEAEIAEPEAEETTPETAPEHEPAVPPAVPVAHVPVAPPRRIPPPKGS